MNMKYFGDVRYFSVSSLDVCRRFMEIFTVNKLIVEAFVCPRVVNSYEVVLGFKMSKLGQSRFCYC